MVTRCGEVHALNDPGNASSGKPRHQCHRLQVPLLIALCQHQGLGLTNVPLREVLSRQVAVLHDVVVHDKEPVTPPEHLRQGRNDPGSVPASPNHQHSHGVQSDTRDAGDDLLHLLLRLRCCLVAHRELDFACCYCLCHLFLRHGIEVHSIKILVLSSMAEIFSLALPPQHCLVADSHQCTPVPVSLGFQTTFLPVGLGSPFPSASTRNSSKRLSEVSMKMYIGRTR